MKKHLKIMVVLLIFALCLSFAACNSGVDYEDYDEAPEGSQRYAVHTVEIDISSKNVAPCIDELTEKNSSFGGYVDNVSRDFYNGEVSWARVTFRVPTENLEAFVAYIEENYETSNKAIESHDVTNRYNSATSQKTMLEEKKVQLEAMLDDIELSAAEKITVINEIANVKTEISEIEQKIGECEEDMRYSEVKIHLYQPTGCVEVFIPFFIFVILPLGISTIAIWRATIKRNRAIRKRREEEAKAAEAARIAENDSQIH